MNFFKIKGQKVKIWWYVKMIIPPIQVEKLVFPKNFRNSLFSVFIIPQEIPSELGRDGLWRARSACAAWESWQIAAMAVPKKVSDFKKNNWPQWRQHLQQFHPKSRCVLCCFVSGWILEALIVSADWFQNRSCSFLRSDGELCLLLSIWFIIYIYIWFYG